MLIINADDWGMNRASTDNILACFLKGVITSASAMVFMADSLRAADLARAAGLATGLHLNLTGDFDGGIVPKELAASQQRIIRFLRRSRYHWLIFNPLLAKDFKRVYAAQYQEYVRLYQAAPAHIDGHHHMHLCANVLLGRLIPDGTKVRRSFTFKPGEKGALNRFCRRCIDSLLIRRYICTDYFYALGSCRTFDRLKEIADLSQSRNVELMVHPGRREDYELVTSDAYLRIVAGESEAAAPCCGTGKHGNSNDHS